MDNYILSVTLPITVMFITVVMNGFALRKLRSAIFVNDNHILNIYAAMNDNIRGELKGVNNQQKINENFRSRLNIHFESIKITGKRIDNAKERIDLLQIKGDKNGN